MHIKELQEILPWTQPYSEEFERSATANPLRRVEHDVLHVLKSLGRIAAECEASDHARERLVEKGAMAKDVADLVICALHIAKCEGFDLQSAVIDSLSVRNGVCLHERERLTQRNTGVIHTLPCRVCTPIEAARGAPIEAARGTPIEAAKERLERTGAGLYVPAATEAPEPAPAPDAFDARAEIERLKRAVELRWGLLPPLTPTPAPAEPARESNYLWEKAKNGAAGEFEK